MSSGQNQNIIYATPGSTVCRWLSCYRSNLWWCSVNCWQLFKSLLQILYCLTISNRKTEVLYYISLGLGHHHALSPPLFVEKHWYLSRNSATLELFLHKMLWSTMRSQHTTVRLIWSDHGIRLLSTKVLSTLLWLWNMDPIPPSYQSVRAVPPMQIGRASCRERV